jgi:TolA-binding protein
MVNQLIDIISQETRLFEEFLSFWSAEGHAGDHDIDALNEITQQQHQKLAESHSLNRLRDDVIDRIKRAMALEGDVTVTRLLEFVDQNQAERLLQLREIIRGLDDKITETRNTNAMLLMQSRESIARTMTMLSRLNSPGGTYRSGGRQSEANATMMVDRRV